jgi:hypothetical protein
MFSKGEFDLALSSRPRQRPAPTRQSTDDCGECTARHREIVRLVEAVAHKLVIGEIKT